MGRIAHREPRQIITFNCPDELVEWLDNYAAKFFMSRTDALIKLIVEKRIVVTRKIMEGQSE